MKMKNSELVVLLFFVVLNAAPVFGKISIPLILNYFDVMKVRNVVLYACNERDNYLLFRAFNKNGVTVASIGPTQKTEGRTHYLFRTPDRLGVVVDGSCTENLQILKFASKSKNFNSRRIWLLFWNEPLLLSEIRVAAEQEKPAMFDIELFLREEYDGMKKRERMEAINSEINAQLYKDLKFEKRKEVGRLSLANITISSQLKDLLNIRAMVDSELTIAIPNNLSNAKWSLWSMHRKTTHSVLEIDEMSRIGERDKLDLSSFVIPPAVRRNNFHGAIMRAGCGLNYDTYFNRSDELTLMPVIDRWAQMFFGHMMLIEQGLNFRMLVKCFSDYGWPTNGSYNGLVGFLQREKAEMTAVGFLFHIDRWNAIDYIDGTFQFRSGLVFRQPPLSQVANIFVMPFSSQVWLALTALLVVTGAIFYAQLRMTLSVKHGALEHLGDVVSLLSGAMCQQGYHFVYRTVATRVSIVVVLISTIFFFTSYTATIVALLQSPSHLINSVEAFVGSSMAIGVEDQIYERKFFEEDSHEVIKELYAKKVKPLGENAYLQVSNGTERIRKGLFAFQGDLVSMYKIISSTYTENEKCGLEEMELFPKNPLGPALPKNSPYREIFAGRMRWLREVGITDRTVVRWGSKKPKCESKSTGFSSIGFTDIKPLINIFFYGLCSAVCVLFIEILLRNGGKLRRKTKVKPIRRRRRRRRNKWM